MHFYPVPIWKDAPFLRLLIPFTLGILTQWNLKLPGPIGWSGTIAFSTLLVLFSFKKITSRFRRYWLSGIFLNCSFFFAGLMTTFFANVINHPRALTTLYTEGSFIVAKLEEPLSQKPNSYKGIASVQVAQMNDSLFFPKGKIIIYFEKDSLIAPAKRTQIVTYGSRICFSKKLQPIKNTGNPGAFDYKRYCAFQGIYYQVYLKPADYYILPSKEFNKLRQLLFDTRKYILNVLREHIPGQKESGLAEALLIGYKDDLDKNLVQSYSNTGVVHVIAISGLHVGLIYWLLAVMVKPLTKRKSLRFLKPLLTITGLWLFTFLAGGSPSVVRSAVMFTFIVVGQNFSRKISIYNSLAASAFLLLCYHPFWLWDVGFQLSYAAVLSIVIFMKPIYNLWFVENKLLDGVWKLNAVTLSAQILTIPMCLYYFHQFPNFFLITNLVAVPLSSVILLGELSLFVGVLLPAVAQKIGWLLHWLIWMMNTFIERIDRLPFSVAGNIRISSAGLIFLYTIVIFSSIWLFKRKHFAVFGALTGIFLFGLTRFHSKLTLGNQRQLIVYNIPLHQAIDFVDGENYLFLGDSNVVKDDFLQSFHLKPARVTHRAKQSDSIAALFSSSPYFLFSSTTIGIIDKPFSKNITDRKFNIDIIIISKNPGLSIADIQNKFSFKQLIFDGSNSLSRITKWKMECLEMDLPCYSIPDKGAFVMNLN